MYSQIANIGISDVVLVPLKNAEQGRSMIGTIATHCNTLQHTATQCNTMQHTAQHCNPLQHTAANCNTLQQTATDCNRLQQTATHCNRLLHTATHGNTLQHTATHCNTLDKADQGRSVIRTKRMNESCHTYGWVTGEDLYICATWLVHVCDMTPSYMDAEKEPQPWLLSHYTRANECGSMSHFIRVNECSDQEPHIVLFVLRRDSFICVTWPSYTGYGVASISRLLKNLGLFCRISSLL